MKKFQNKYRIESVRLKGYDYGQNGAYFITICTAQREHYFGEIVNGKMNLNELGRLAEKYWLEIPDQFGFVKLGRHVIMPNHTHGILIINKSDGGSRNDVIIPRNDVIIPRRDAINRVSTGDNVDNVYNVDNGNKPNKSIGGFAGDKNPMFHENISRIIRWYKGRCTFEIRKIHTDFAWQSLFYDHIIRNETAFQKITHYINNNPKNWENDNLK